MSGEANCSLFDLLVDRFGSGALLENRTNVPSALEHMENHNVLVFDTVKHYVCADCDASQAGPQVIATTSEERMFREQRKLIIDSVEQALRRFDARALGRNVVPDVVQFRKCRQTSPRTTSLKTRPRSS